MSSLLHAMNPELIKFLLVAVFSLLIGLEQRRHNINVEFENLFGTDRTFTLIGILGFILYRLEPRFLLPFLGGGLVIASLLCVFYYQKINLKQKFGLTSIVTALITYCLAPLVYTQPLWMVLLIVVCILVVTEIKETLLEVTQKFDNEEFITLAKFLVLAGVILPLLPDEPISAEINISPYRFWLAIVVVAGISYLSYLVKKFIFPDAGLLLTGILGGLYSSTATTVILARKSKEESANNRIVPAIMLATTMMYLRIFLLALFFNQKIAMGLLPYFVIFIIVSLGLVFCFARFNNHIAAETIDQTVKLNNNPLEFKIAVVFGTLFIFFAIATTYISKTYGGAGVNIMAFVVGVTDIDPFILNLFQSKMNIADSVIIVAVLNAISSNNLLKMAYAIGLSDKSLRKEIFIGFSVLVAVSLILVFVPPIHHLLTPQ